MKFSIGLREPPPAISANSFNRTQHHPSGSSKGFSSPISLSNYFK